MSDGGSTRRARTGEATEQLRHELRASGRCIKCGRPSSTWRCAECTAKIEAATGRYHGRGRPGSPTKISSDLVDLRHAFEAIAKTVTGFGEVARTAAELPRRRQLELLAEPLAQLGLATRLARGVLKRNLEPATAAVSRRRARRPAPPQLSFPFYAGAA